MAQADNTQVGAGQMYPLDSTDEFSMLSFIIRQMIAEMETCTPVQVVAIHPGSGTPPAVGTVDVQLLVSQIDGSGNAQKQGIVYGVPYMRMQGGPWAIVIEPAAGDFGFIVSASRDISNVVKNPGQQNPGSYRQHSFSDGFYIGGAMNKSPTAYAWFKPDGTFQITDKNGVMLQTDPSGNLKLTGNLQVTGSITAGFGGADQIGLQTHKHVDSTGHFTTAPVVGT
jgi:hypothetical protein